MKALKAQGMSRDDLPYKAPLNPWGSWFAMIITSIILFFKGYDTFMPFKVDTFITYVSSYLDIMLPADDQHNTCSAYIAIPVFAILWLGYKLFHKTKVIPSEQVDLISGLQQINEEEERYILQEQQKGPRTWWQRLWESL